MNNGTGGLRTPTQSGHNSKGQEMDTKAVATLLGTETRILRRFLRDPKSTFKAVGSGSRYEFTEADIPELERRFSDWLGTKQANRPAITIKTVVDTVQVQRERDEAVWAEEGTIIMPDIRRPEVRSAVRAKARDWDRRLNERLMAAGLHISQMQNRQLAAA